jgi:antitoxin (DNA-binding transcriptional repressor) of toxin-antitoxin stability system
MQGEVFVITRWGRPVARLLPVVHREVSVPMLREG